VQAQRYRDIVTKAIKPMKEWQFGIRSIILRISFEHDKGRGRDIRLKTGSSDIRRDSLGVDSRS
jgi:hypothetical protein